MHHRQTQAGALAKWLGGEERLEYAVDDRRRDPHAGIRDDHRDVVFGLLRRPTDAGGIGADGECQFATSRHCVPGVGGQVEDRLLEGSRVDLHQRRPATGLPPEHDRLTDQASNERFDGRQEVVQVHRLGRERDASRERQKLARQDGGMLGGAEDRPRVVLRIGTLARGDQRSEAGDRREAVVEVVGHSAGQLTDRFQALGLHQARCDRLALGHVDELDHDAGMLAVHAELDRVVDLRPQVPPIPGLEYRQSRSFHVPGGDGIADPPSRPGPLLLWNETLNVLAEDLGGRPAQVPLGRGVPGSDEALGVECQRGQRRMLDQRLESLRAVLLGDLRQACLSCRRLRFGRDSVPVRGSPVQGNVAQTGTRGDEHDRQRYRRHVGDRRQAGARTCQRRPDHSRQPTGGQTEPQFPALEHGDQQDRAEEGQDDGNVEPDGKQRSAQDRAKIKHGDHRRDQRQPWPAGVQGPQRHQQGTTCQQGQRDADCSSVRREKGDLGGDHERHAQSGHKGQPERGAARHLVRSGWAHSGHRGATARRATARRATARGEVSPVRGIPAAAVRSCASEPTRTASPASNKGRTAFNERGLMPRSMRGGSGRVQPPDGPHHGSSRHAFDRPGGGAGSGKWPARGCVFQGFYRIRCDKCSYGTRASHPPHAPQASRSIRSLTPSRSPSGRASTIHAFGFGLTEDSDAVGAVAAA